MEDFRTIHEIAKAARRNLNDNLWDYLVGGADAEAALRRNRLALDAFQFKPRVLRDVSQVSAMARFLGKPMRLPVVVPPLGSVQDFEPGGGATVAAAAQAFGVPMILSSACQPGFEAVAAAADAAWTTAGEASTADARSPASGSPPAAFTPCKVYQLYLVGDEAWMDDIIARAIAAGFDAFCLTVDTAVYTRRERDIAKRFVPSSGRRADGGAFGSAGPVDFLAQARMTWATVAHIKERFDIPLMLKGIQRGDDAARAVEHGVEIVCVSNHGGRQLDHARAPIDALPEVVEAVAGKAEVVVDGGFMRGADVAKGLCLGADMVGMGRLLALAMAAGGEAAAVRALELVEEELRIVMALLGASALSDLAPELVERGMPLPGKADPLAALPLLAEGY